MANRTFGGGGDGKYYGTGGYRNSGRGGGGGGGGFTLTLPPFHGAVKQLILINCGVFFGTLLIGLFSQQLWARYLLAGIHDWLYLIPEYVLHGRIWQIVTYSFFHGGLLHILGNMLQLWFFGYPMEDMWGRKQFYEFYFFSVIGAAITTIIVSYTGLLGITPGFATLGASGGVFGILVAYALYFGENEIMLLLPPVQLKAKYLVWIMVLVNLAWALGAGGPGGVAYTAHLGGALFAYIYVKFLPRKGLGFATSEGYYGMRNSYYKWKRRRAAKKFEVYMKKHDKSDYFDQYGNFKPPDEDKKNGGNGPGGWVN